VTEIKPLLNLEVGGRLDSLLERTREAMTDAADAIDPSRYHRGTTFREVLRLPTGLYVVLSHYAETQTGKGAAVRIADLLRKLRESLSADNAVQVSATITEMNSLVGSMWMSGPSFRGGQVSKLLSYLDADLHAYLSGNDPAAKATAVWECFLLEKWLRRTGYNAFYVSELATDVVKISKAEMESQGLSLDDPIEKFDNVSLIRRHRAFFRAANDRVLDFDSPVFDIAEQDSNGLLSDLNSTDPTIRTWAVYGSAAEMAELKTIVGEGADSSVFDSAGQPFEFGRLAALLKTSGMVPSVHSRLVEGIKTYKLQRIPDLLDYSRLQAIPMENGQNYEEVIADLEYAKMLEQLLGFDPTEYSRALTNAKGSLPLSAYVESREGDIIFHLKEEIKGKFGKYGGPFNPPEYYGNDDGKSFRKILESLRDVGSTTEMGAANFFMHVLLQHSNYISTLPGVVMAPFHFSHLRYAGAYEDDRQVRAEGIFIDKPLYHHDLFWVWYVGDNTFRNMKQYRKNLGWEYDFSSGTLLESFPLSEDLIVNADFARYAPSWIVSALT
jgi:hypothetical protein